MTLLTISSVKLLPFISEIYILYPTPNFFFIPLAVSYITNLPLLITTILSDKASASSKWWVVNITHFPSYLKILKRFHTSLLESGSIPEVGSSK